MRERKRDQVTTDSAISAWLAANTVPITTVRRTPPVQPGDEQKANMIGWTRRGAFGRAPFSFTGPSTVSALG